MIVGNPKTVLPFSSSYKNQLSPKDMLKQVRSRSLSTNSNKKLYESQIHQDPNESVYSITEKFKPIRNILFDREKFEIKDYVYYNNQPWNGTKILNQSTNNSTIDFDEFKNKHNRVSSATKLRKDQNRSYSVVTSPKEPKKNNMEMFLRKLQKNKEGVEKVKNFDNTNTDHSFYNKDTSHDFYTKKVNISKQIFGKSLYEEEIHCNTKNAIEAHNSDMINLCNKMSREGRKIFAQFNSQKLGNDKSYKGLNCLEANTSSSHFLNKSVLDSTNILSYTVSNTPQNSHNRSKSLQTSSNNMNHWLNRKHSRQPSMDSSQKFVEKLGHTFNKEPVHKTIDRKFNELLNQECSQPKITKGKYKPLSQNVVNTHHDINQSQQDRANTLKDFRMSLIENSHTSIMDKRFFQNYNYYSRSNLHDTHSKSSLIDIHSKIKSNFHNKTKERIPDKKIKPGDSVGSYYWQVFSKKELPVKTQAQKFRKDLGGIFRASKS